jgi:translation initiation factor 3 subunit E
VNPDKVLAASWGRLACEILLANWDQANEELNRLRDLIENKSQFTHVQLLQQRTWLLHWSLFIFFQHPKGRDMIVDLFFLPQFINTLQVTCPYLLRYLTGTVILNKRRRSVLKDLVKIIQQEMHNYRDPVTDFLNCLQGDCDFEKAQKYLGECGQVLLITTCVLLT